MQTTQREERFVFHDPLHGLTARKLHGLRDGRGEIDIPLFTGFAADELNFRVKTQEKYSLRND